MKKNSGLSGKSRKNTFEHNFYDPVEFCKGNEKVPETKVDQKVLPEWSCWYLRLSLLIVTRRPFS